MGDNLTPEQRRRSMANVRNKDTGLELLVRSRLHRAGLRFRKNVRHLPGSPDIVFPKAKVAVFVDGDFWHGYRFEERKDRMPLFWREKIGKNRDRDQRADKALHLLGWEVVRIWQHDIQSDVDGVVSRIGACVRTAGPSRALPH